MDSEAPESSKRLAQFLSDHVKLEKINVRQWGGFELAMSFDQGQTWAGFGRPFGAAYTLQEAAITMLEELTANAAQVGQLITIMGPNLWNALQDALSDGAVDETVVEVETPNEITLLKVPNVPECLGDEPQ